MCNMELSKVNFLRMIDLTPELLCISDMGGYFKYVNPAFEKILGYSVCEAMELNLYSLIHQDDRTLLEEMLKLSDKKNNQDLSFEYRYRCKDGAYKWISWNLRIQLEEGLVYSVGYDITDRRVMENELRESYERLYNVLSNAGAIITHIDKNGTIILNEGKVLNRIYSKLSEYKGRNISEFYNQNKSVIDNARKALNGKEINTEIKINGITLDINFSPFTNASGSFAGGIAIAIDITERKRVEEELRNTKEKLQGAQEFAQIGYWEFNTISKECIWSDELFRICGFKVQEFTPTINDFINMIYPDDKAIVINAAEGPLRNNEYELDFRIIRADKEVIWISEKVRFEFNENGKLIRKYGIVRDISQRKVEEQKLRESEEKYKNLADNVPVGIISYDKDGNVTFLNEKVLEILGSPSKDASMSLNLFTFPQLIKYGISDVYKQCIENGKLVTAEKQYVSKWGKSIVTRIQAAPIKDDNGHTLSAISIIEDFTERKGLELELHMAKEQAELSNKSKSQFLANMSHEIRTPMNGIMGMTELLNITTLNHEQSEMVKIINASSESLLKIINDILDLSKIDAGKIEINPEPINVFSFISPIFNLFRVLAQEKRLDFDVSVENDIPKEIIVDKTRLAQVLNNIIGNAIKFTEKGKITISIKKVKTIDNKVELMFSIADTGIGIKEEDIPKLFTYFTQLEDFLTKQFKGTGLGLAISKRLVELMNGEICVESEYGKGSTFYFTCLVGISKGEQKTLNSKCILTPHESVNKLNILVVEDDYVSQLIMKQICKLKNWQVQVVSNGKEALDILERNHYDLILMDIQMPEMSGFDLTKIIREKEKLTGSHIKIIATTAYAMNEDKERCLNAGMDDFISKPINIEKLYEKVTAT